jgi:Domain of unknown function (DUF4615)
LVCVIKNKIKIKQAPVSVTRFSTKPSFVFILYFFFNAEFISVWCVKQLELSLESGKLNEKRASEARRSIRVLRNPETPLIKLRQLMRTTFGDYRAKMAAEEKSAKLDESKVKMVTDGAPSGGSKFTFIKKAASKTGTGAGTATAESTEKSDFKFSFNIPGE